MKTFEEILEEELNKVNGHDYPYYDREVKVWDGRCGVIFTAVEIYAGYWKKRCELAEKFIEESPGDPDITKLQREAYANWQNFISQKPQPKISSSILKNSLVCQLSVDGIEYLESEHLSSLRERDNLEVQLWTRIVRQLKNESQHPNP